MDELQNFLRKALEIQLGCSEKDLTQDELKAIALRAGLAEDDWNRICSELEAHLTRGRNFLRFKNAGDAVRELDQAEMLAPYRVDVLADCARAHQLHWEETSAPNSKERATDLYEKCLRLEPHHVEAAEGLSSLRSRGRRFGSGKGARKRILASASIAVLLLTVAGVVAWNGLTVDPPRITVTEERPLIGSETVESVPNLTKEEFADWIMAKEFSFAGMLVVKLTFEEGHVRWESAGRIWRHPYTVDSPGRVTIHRDQDFKLAVYEDLRRGSFESNRGKYFLTVSDRN